MAQSKALPLARRWMLALVLLVAIDGWVRGHFFDQVITPRFVAPFQLLRERSGSRHWGILFDALERRPRPAVRIGLFGDSTVNATDTIGDHFSVARLLSEELRRRFPNDDLEIVDFSGIGLLATEIAIDLGKATRSDLDILVWGATLRAFSTTTAYKSSLPREIGAADLGRLTSVGALRWILEAVGGASLLEGSLQSIWRLYGYNTELKFYAWENFVEPLLVDLPAVRANLAPVPAPPLEFLPTGPSSPKPYRWMKVEYDTSGANWGALPVIGGLCERYAAGRCLIYSGPLNPTDRTTLSEPGLYDDYLARLRIEVGRRAIMWRDFTDVMTAEDFRRPMYPTQKFDPIHLNLQGGAKLATLLADALESRIRAALGARRSS